MTSASRNAIDLDVDRGLYAIVDADALQGRPVVPFVGRLLAAGPLCAVQLRAKPWSARVLLDVARAVGPLCREVGVPFFVNDRPDVAWLAGADGVHVGTGDLPIAEVRKVAPGLAVGASSHNRSEVEQALAQSPDYLAFGPVFGTRSKADAAPVVGLDDLGWAAQQAGDRPLVAIGGISLENAAAVRDAGAHAAAVISALMVEDRLVTDVARALHVELGGRAWTR